MCISVYGICPLVFATVLVLCSSVCFSSSDSGSCVCSSRDGLVPTTQQTGNVCRLLHFQKHWWRLGKTKRKPSPFVFACAVYTGLTRSRTASSLANNSICNATRRPVRVTQPLSSGVTGGGRSPTSGHDKSCSRSRNVVPRLRRCFF